MQGTVEGIFISSVKGEAMQEVKQVLAIANEGLEGDRYCTGDGSFNRETKGRRQVTLINGIFFEGTGFEYKDSRRNIVTNGVELMWLIGREFKIGEAIFKGVKYCDPCNRPSNLSGNPKSFKEVFWDRGGLIAEVIQGGIIRKGDPVIPPKKDY